MEGETGDADELEFEALSIEPTEMERGYGHALASGLMNRVYTEPELGELFALVLAAHRLHVTACEHSHSARAVDALLNAILRRDSEPS